MEASGQREGRGLRRNAVGLPGLIAQSLGVTALFNFGSEEDRKDASRVIAAAVQGGLGLPDRDYYTKTDEKSSKLRDKYVAHVARMLELAGAPRAKASSRAKTILALETKLAEASQTNVDIRDPDKTYHPKTLEAFSAETPNLAWASYFQQQHVPDGVAINVWQPDFFRAADNLVKSEPLATWKTWAMGTVTSSSSRPISHGGSANRSRWDCDFAFRSARDCDFAFRSARD